jgi:CrcB protein
MDAEMSKILWLALAGIAGTLARYWLGGAVQGWSGPAFPWGTLAVNALGCLLFGFFWTLATERGLLSPETRTVILVGFMGAFTTFSSFAFETAQLMRDEQWLYAAANVVAQLVLGLVCMFVGFALGRLL